MVGNIFQPGVTALILRESRKTFIICMNFLSSAYTFPSLPFFWRMANTWPENSCVLRLDLLKYSLPYPRHFHSFVELFLCADLHLAGSLPGATCMAGVCPPLESPFEQEKEKLYKAPTKTICISAVRVHNNKRDRILFTNCTYIQ